MTNIRRTILVLFLLGDICSCRPRQVITNEFHNLKREKVEYNYETGLIDTATLIRRKNRKLIFLTFFGDFNDTVVLYINNKERQRIAVPNSQYTSTDYTGIEIGIQFWKNASRTVQLKLIGHQSYVEIKIDEHYPLCALYRKHGYWTLSFRKAKMIIK